MEFMSSRPNVVRSDSQRWLLQYWGTLRGRLAVPPWHNLDPEALAIPSSDLSLTEVVPADGNARFRIRFHGQRVGELFGRVTCVGKYLDEILPSGYSQASLLTYRQVVEAALPVYTVSDMRDRGGRIVHYERLLLPFSGDGANVDRVLASLETVSPEGDFDHSEMMKAPPRPPAFALCTTIRL